MRYRTATPFLALFVAALACSVAPLFPPTTAYIIDVFANQGWQATSITLEQGQLVQVQYLAGQWTDWVDRVPLFGAEGGDYVCPYRNCCEPLPQEHKGALIGRISQVLFLVGAAESFTVPASGSLYLRMNDCLDALHDNAGFLRIKLVP